MAVSNFYSRFALHNQVFYKAGLDTGVDDVNKKI